MVRDRGEAGGSGREMGVGGGGDRSLDVPHPGLGADDARNGQGGGAGGVGQGAEVSGKFRAERRTEQPSPHPPREHELDYRITF